MSRFFPSAKGRVKITTRLVSGCALRRILRELRRMNIPAVYHEFRGGHYGTRAIFRDQSNGISSNSFTIRESDLAFFMIRFGDVVKMYSRKGDSFDTLPYRFRENHTSPNWKEPCQDKDGNVIKCLSKGFMHHDYCWGRT